MRLDFDVLHCHKVSTIFELYSMFSTLLEVFISENFTKVGEKNARTKLWNVACNYCPAGTPAIEHGDMRCLKHLSKPRGCQNVPADVRKEAGQLIMQGD